MIGKTISHYRVLDRLGSGGMGVVYRAEDTKLERNVALKFLPLDALEDKQALDRFLREARAAAALNHPNICIVHEISEDLGQPFIVMELLEGEVLKQRISGIPLKISELVDIAIQIAEGLEAAHAKGVTHRDIKPANIFITRARQAKILDFGLAKLTTKRPRTGAAGVATGEVTAVSEADINLTSPGSAIGTVSYMSPEQARGEDLDARTDLFSFGGVLYEMATASMPFTGSTSAVIFDSILHGTPEAPSSLNADVPAELERIINKGLEKDRELRYQTASEMKTDLRRLKRDLESGARAGAAARKSGGISEGAAPAVAAEKSVAVLYFENLSGAKEDEYFRDGMTEDIITELSKISQLRIFPRSEMLAFRDKSVSAPQIGQQLNAAYVLEGTIRRAASRLRISAQLVDIKARRSIWAERYDRQMEDVFAIQDEIARAIAQALRITLTPQEEKVIARRPTENLRAYDFYLRGRSYARRENVDFALQMFEQAIRLDPDFALAHAGIGYVCGLLFLIREQKHMFLERGRAACDKALALDPQLPEGLSARARLCYTEKNYDEAIRLTQMALNLKPDCDGAYDVLCRAYFASGQYQKAADLADVALATSGDDYNVYIPIMQSFGALHQEERMREICIRLQQALEKQLELVPEDVRARILLSCLYARDGKEEEAVRHVETAVALRPTDSSVLYNAACAYGILTRKKDTIDMLRRAKDVGYGNWGWVTRDPDLECVRDDPEFKAIVEAGLARDAAGRLPV